MSDDKGSETPGGAVSRVEPTPADPKMGLEIEKLTLEIVAMRKQQHRSFTAILLTLLAVATPLLIAAVGWHLDWQSHSFTAAQGNSWHVDEQYGRVLERLNNPQPTQRMGAATALSTLGLATPQLQEQSISILTNSLEHETDPAVTGQIIWATLRLNEGRGDTRMLRAMADANRRAQASIARACGGLVGRALWRDDRGALRPRLVANLDQLDSLEQDTVVRAAAQLRMRRLADYLARSEMLYEERGMVGAARGFALEPVASQSRFKNMFWKELERTVMVDAGRVPGSVRDSNGLLAAVERGVFRMDATSRGLARLLNAKSDREGVAKLNLSGLTILDSDLRGTNLRGINLEVRISAIVNAQIAPS